MTRMIDLKDMIVRTPRLLKDLLRNRSGNFGLMTALVAVPLMLVVGLAVDFNNAQSAKLILQQDLDGGLLQIAQNAQNLSATDIQNNVKTWIEAQPNLRPFMPLSETITVDQTNNAITATVQGRVPTAFLPFAWHDDDADQCQVIGGHAEGHLLRDPCDPR